MRLTGIELRDFRNVHRAEVALSERLNLVFGENGQGKTNFLEAVWFLATQRPLRGSRVADLVRWGEQGCEVRGAVQEEVTTRLAVRVAGGRREARADGKVVARVEAEVLERFGVRLVREFEYWD